jgi:hypothetical protein
MSDGGILGYPGMYNWLKEIHNGKKVSPGCQTVSVAVDSFATMLPGESSLFVGAILENLLAMLGIAIGGP